jgi:cyclophilin family peptidyl-prolyl cis-trans isomerase/HEAT repeat protein
MSHEDIRLRQGLRRATLTTRRFFVPVVIAFCLAGLVATPSAQSLRARMLAAEDARVTTDTAIAPLVEGARNADGAVAAQALRGLGRLERPAFVKLIQPSLQDARAVVRRAAAWALGQSLARTPRTGPAPPELAAVTRALVARLKVEREPDVAGTIAEVLGRLPHRTAAAIADVEQAIRPWLTHPGSFRGLESLIRLNRKVHPPASATLDALRTAVVADRAEGKDSGDAALMRRLAWLALNTASAADLALAARGLGDPDDQVRRLATTAVGNAAANDPARRDLLLRALRDPSFHVRYEAVRAYGRALQQTDCAPLIAATDDANPHVAIGAIDALGAGCMAGPSPISRLAVLADGLPAAAPGRWQIAAHALTSLARVGRDEAAARLPAFAAHATWQVRAYAARAAASLPAATTLEKLAGDANDNVRYEAVVGLRQVRGRAADGVFVEALARRDYQLVLAAAEALEGSTAASAAPALVHAFERITAERRETSRDTRLALLARIRELGSATHARALQSCLTDFDARVAAECSAILVAWTGVRRTPRPTRIPPAPIVEPLPARARMVLRAVRKDGQERHLELRLFPGDAPATVARFATLARAGYYNGLTIHRVVPNFVLQGGSPGANEYAGDGPFMRDELWRPNLRGTVGVSTRGRDTGDAQFFINLLDNPRLDADYTVFAEVTAGMDVVDQVLEGDVIERVEILPSPAAAR